MHQNSMHPIFSITAFEAQQSNWKLIYFKETDSTNKQAKQAVDNATETQLETLSGSVFLTDKQNQGKGRRNNQWTSSPGEDLLFTVVLDTGLPLTQIQKIATTTALALAMEIEKYEIRPMIKFPNDIYIDDKKTAGILIEQIKQFTLIGVGINVNSTPTLTNSTSLIQQQTEDALISREELLSSFLSQLVTQLNFCKDYFAHIQQNLSKYDLFYGKKIQFTQNSSVHTGTAMGISPNGYLLVAIDRDNKIGLQNIPIEICSGHTFRLA